MMADQTFLDKMVSQLRSSFKYYTGYPKDLGPSRIIPFTSERQFVQLLHEGRPVVVAFTIKCPYTQHLDKVLEEAAATFYPHIKFVRVDCPKYPGFCLTRQKNEYPFIEVFYNPEQAASQGKGVDPNITKYSVKVLPFNYDQSVYGFREYFKKHGFSYSETKVLDPCCLSSSRSLASPGNKGPTRENSSFSDVGQGRVEASSSSSGSCESLGNVRRVQRNIEHTEMRSSFGEKKTSSSRASQC